MKVQATKNEVPDRRALYCFEHVLQLPADTLARIFYDFEQTNSG